MSEPMDLRDMVIEVLMEAKRDGLPVMVMLSDSASTSKIAPFAARYPESVVNVGIAEQNMVGMAAGIALTGSIAVTANAAPFLLHRSYEQVKLDVCYNNTNVKMLSINAGFAYGQLGNTHHAVDDIATIRSCDHVQIFAPADAPEAREVMRHALRHVGPVYIRMDNIKVELIHEDSYRFTPGAIDIVRQGKDVLICSLGTLLPAAVQAGKALAAQGMDPTVANFSSIRPLDRNALRMLLDSHSHVVVVEEHSMHGGLTALIYEVVVSERLDAMVASCALPEGRPTLAGTRGDLRAHYGLDATGVVRKVMEMLS